MQLTVFSSAGVAGARPSNASEESVWVTVFSVSTEIAGNAGPGAAAGADVFAAVHAQSPTAAARTMGRIIHLPAVEIGRASSRERVGTNVRIPVGPLPLKKKTN